MVRKQDVLVRLSGEVFISERHWIPACAGMTGNSCGLIDLTRPPSRSA
jgi:hypothetical protein